jgi:hypothetical protein
MLHQEGTPERVLEMLVLSAALDVGVYAAYKFLLKPVLNWLTKDCSKEEPAPQVQAQAPAQNSWDRYQSFRHEAKRLSYEEAREQIANEEEQKIAAEIAARREQKAARRELQLPVQQLRESEIKAQKAAERKKELARQQERLSFKVVEDPNVYKATETVHRAPKGRLSRMFREAQEQNSSELVLSQHSRKCGR